MLQTMFIAGANLLDEKKDIINELNVFPVPDGDTGTNMSLTMLATAKEVQNIKDLTIKNIAKAASTGSLRGARGNSGVILSQLIRGFSRGLQEETIDVLTIANAFQLGVDTAYKAVMKPKEGTILTVAKGLANKAVQLSMEITDLEDFAREVITYGYEVLNKTPDMLPVLKEAGVVDAGGQGLMTILEGAARAIFKEDMKLTLDYTPTKNTDAFYAIKHFNTDEITFGYCTEFIIQKNSNNKFIEEKTKKFLDTIGDSIVVVSDEEFVKIHVHTDNPGLAIEHGLKFGSLTNIKIDNMREQHSSIFDEQEAKEPEKEIAFVSIASGSGIAEIMKSLGVTKVIEGGQTMNPSTEDIEEAIKQVNAKKVIVLPNNKNIILAAEQVKQLVNTCQVEVVPTKSIPQGVSAMISYDGSTDIDDITKNMNEAIKAVQTAQITMAVRYTTMHGETIEEGEYLGILEGDIVVHNKNLKETFKRLLKSMNQDAEVITIYYGEDIDKKTAEKYEKEAAKIFDQADIELHHGNQPVYHFMISAE
ncbi:dihydroxyacetone kinase [Candidatus Epulonipiscium fishelsonii]|uniref:Dihydroxyacetone kinase n=1 Tax=Candidatus Epulonipiscium fishelsonii TaxID=77094 RepID=A0ACC8XG39_9FIRM|nr:dihydroxyacetone kinase [Epulopiscium sp. SCG-B11WGA-EpuloA1]ONI42883.1 dihydroxyacetone kinase [Epulopiscium sp. SCG-B05WGA-EpuloA1]